MQVHLFGATSSPSYAAYALKLTADDHAHLFEPEVGSTLLKNFYVDDCLKSVPSEKGAAKLARPAMSDEDGWLQAYKVAQQKQRGS